MSRAQSKNTPRQHHNEPTEDKAVEECSEMRGIEPPLGRLLDQYLINKNLPQFILQLAYLVQEHYNKHQHLDNCPVGNDKVMAEQLSAKLQRFAVMLIDYDNLVQALQVLLSEINNILLFWHAGTWKQLENQLLHYLNAIGNRRANNQYSPVTLVSAKKKPELAQQSLLRLHFFNSGHQKSKSLYYESFTLNSKVYIFKAQIQQYQLKNQEPSSINLRFLNVSRVYLDQCNGISYLDVSHTQINHLDTRQLTELTELHLMNTNIRRVNLINQRRLTKLSCNYTLVDYLFFFACSLLEEIYIEYSGQIKSNHSAHWNIVHFGGRAVINTYQCNAYPEEKLNQYTVAFPEESKNSKCVKIVLPVNCNEIITRYIKECKKVFIDCVDWAQKYFVKSLDFIDFPVLQLIDIYSLRCGTCNIIKLPQTTSIAIRRSSIDKLLICNAPLLQEISIFDTENNMLEMLDLPSLSFLNFRRSKILVSNLREFTSLKFLGSNNCSVLKQAKNLPQLTRINIVGKESDELNIQDFMMLQIIEASDLKIKLFNIKNLSELIEIDITDVQTENIVITNFPKLMSIFAYSIQCKVFALQFLPSLMSINVGNIQISNLQIINLPSLQKLCASNLHCRQFTINNLVLLRILQLRDNNFFVYNLSEFSQLKELHTDNQEQIDLARQSQVAQQLEILIVYNYAIHALNINGLSNLRELDIHDTNIRQIDLLPFEKLKKVVVSENCIISNCCCGTIVQ